MAKEQKQEAKEIDYIQLVEDAQNKAMGSASFTRIKLPKDITTPGLIALNKHFEGTGVEVFINGKHVLLLQQ